jgi:hypothetical protein
MRPFLQVGVSAVVDRSRKLLTRDNARSNGPPQVDRAVVIAFRLGHPLAVVPEPLVLRNRHQALPLHNLAIHRLVG